MADAIPLATIAGIFDQTDHGIAAREFFHYRGGFVAGSIVDDNDLRIPSRFRNVSLHPVQARAKALSLVISRDNEAVARRCHSGAIQEQTI